jgi:hypothetical protein
MTEDNIFRTIKGKYKSFSDFKSHFNLMDNFNFKTTEAIKNDLIKSFECFLKKIEDNYQDGDEIWHYDDFNISPERCGREYILIKRNNKTTKQFMVRMS